MSTEAAGPLDTIFDFELPPAPYPGLRPFDMHEWPIFFGRESQTKDVVDQLIWQQLIVIHGESGCGKSSFIRAGVLVQLQQEHARIGMRWQPITAGPHHGLLENLSRALASAGGVARDSDRGGAIRRALNLGRDAPTALAKQLRRGDDDHICIVIDQFEEVFNFAGQHGRDEAKLIADLLVGLYENPPPGLYAILALRSEARRACGQFEDLAAAVGQTQYLLPRMERSQLLRAIREPAVLYDGDVSRDLADRLIDDAGDDQDQLPLIQHGLMLLWRRKLALLKPDETTESRRLGLEDYRGGGGLAVLLSAHADEVMANAASDPDKRRIVQRLFRELMDVNAEGQVICRPRTLGDLAAITGSEQSILKNIIDRFRAEGFLIPFDNAALESTTPIGISRETLIRCWQKLAAVKRRLQETQDVIHGSTNTRYSTKGVVQAKDDEYDVFIAYAREDKTKADELAMQLKTRGFSVFWDAKVPPGQTWRDYIFQALAKSKCVVAAWSVHSVNSDWVLEEAEVGKRARKLVPVRFDNTELPFGFQFIQAADLSLWPPDVASDTFKDFLGGVTGLVRPGMS